MNRYCILKGRREGEKGVYEENERERKNGYEERGLEIKGKGGGTEDGGREEETREIERSKQ